MATSTVLTNKPINPRGDDNRPVDSYNRASLYSGKALDFDGVNDSVDLNSSIDFTGDFSFCFYFSTAIIGVRGIISNGTNVDSIGTDSTSNKSFRFRLNSVNVAFAINSVYDDGLNFWSFVRSGSTLYVYKNGVQVGSQSVATNTFTLGMVGAQGVGVNYFNGELTNLKAFNTALTAAQVADLYNNPEKVVPTGVDNTALKLWLPMMEGAGTTAINGAPDALGSELVTNGTFDTDSDWTKGTGWSISGGTASCDGSQSGNSILFQNIGHSANKLYQVEFTISDYVSGQIDFALDTPFFGATSSNGTFIFGAIPPSGGNFIIRADADFVGSIDNVSVKEVQNCGTISGATWTHGIGAPIAQTSVIDWNKHTLDGTNAVLIPQGLTAGRDLLGNLFENVRKQGALNLDGNSWAEVHDNASLDVTTAITLGAWVYNDGTETFKGVLAKWGTQAGVDRCYMLYKQDEDDYRFDINGTSLNTGAAVASGWNHLVGVWDSTSTNKYFYVNGTLSASTTQSATIVTSTKPVEIGRYGYTSNNAFDDQIAQPRIYNRALTASEVLNNFNATKDLYI